MTSELEAVLDACTLVNASVRDALLRLAERRLYRPRWRQRKAVLQFVRIIGEELV